MQSFEEGLSTSSLSVWASGSHIHQLCNDFPLGFNTTAVFDRLCSHLMQGFQGFFSSFDEYKLEMQCHKVITKAKPTEKEVLIET